MNKRALIKKGLLLCGLVLMLPAAVSAQSPSMVPDDFDWSIYIQDWENAWNEGWEHGGNNNWNNNGGYAGDTSWNYGWENSGNNNWNNNGGYAGDTSWNYGWENNGSNDWNEQYSYAPYSYEWYGETYYVQPLDGYGVESSEYVPVPVYSQEDDSWYYDTRSIDSASDLENAGSWNGILPSTALLSDFVGYAQSYTLDCETRSAVDLAAYMGVNIDHDDFLNRLPRSDDPNEGFVGNVNDPRGQIPPASYGVYQEPVAALLRQYGLSAVGVSGYTKDALKAQIASGRPVMVWVVGNTEIGYGTSYTPSNGRTTMVAPYQHTVVVIGYDESNVTIQDGANRYSRPWETFDISWGALGNRAIYINR